MGDDVPVTPARLHDTRLGGAPPVPAGGVVDVAVARRAGVPLHGVAAASLNVTVVDATGPGFLTVHPTGGGVPLASNLNYDVGQTSANHVIGAVGPDGRVSVLVATSAAHVIVDIDGWISADPAVTGLRVGPIEGGPQRLDDSRRGGRAQHHRHRTERSDLRVGLRAGSTPAVRVQPQRRRR